MDKQGTLYFRLLSALLACVLLLYGLHRLYGSEGDYLLQSTQISEVGDGITVPGFVVRYERLLYGQEDLPLRYEEGQWVSGQQILAQGSNSSLLSPHSGYLSHEIDGYEELLTPEFVKSARASELFSLQPQQYRDAPLGRLITSQHWFFAAAPCPEVQVGQSLSLILEGRSYKAKVLRSQELLLLECIGGLQELSHLRAVEAQLSFGSQRGILLSAEAIRYEEGTSCVYLLEGGRARRKTVSILSLEGEQVLLKEDALPQGAQVILSNIELTDGMILK